MEKLHLQTTNQVDENIKRIGVLYPNCITERPGPTSAMSYDWPTRDPIQLEWVMTIKCQVEQQEAAFFFKQWGT